MTPELFIHLILYTAQEIALTVLAKLQLNPGDGVTYGLASIGACWCAAKLWKIIFLSFGAGVGYLFLRSYTA